MREPDARAFAAVVQQAGHQEVGVGRIGPSQSGRHVKAVAPVGDRHGIEERRLGGRQPAGEIRALARGDAGVKISPRPPNPG
jgi:hypothetical protein